MIVWGNNVFNKIWKEQIVKPTSKVGIFKPKQGFELEEEDDKDKCCEEAKTQYKILWSGSVEKYDKDVADDYIVGIGNYSCDKFKEIMNGGRKKGWELATKVLNEWEECEKNVQ